MTNTYNDNEFEGLDSFSATPEVNEISFESSDVNVNAMGGNTTNEHRQPTLEDDISVHVINNTTPIVLFLGAPSSGKTMTLVRLAKYLRSKGYQITVDPYFCRSAWEYEENMNNFHEMLVTEYALRGINRNDFLFIKIRDSKGNEVCQLLDGAGENFFPTQGRNSASLAFPKYMIQVFCAPNKKVWTFFAEPNWGVDYRDNVEYVRRIQYCKHQYSGNKDKFIVLYNKVDRSGTMIDKDSVNVKAARKRCNDEFPNIFRTFEKKGFWGRSIKCEFVPFCTGLFGELNSSGRINYFPSSDSYPARLWNTILKSIK